MKRFLSIVSTFVLTFASLIGLVGCAGHDRVDKLLFVYNNQTYNSGANIEFKYGDAIDFNKTTVRFMQKTKTGRETHIAFDEFDVTLIYTPLNSEKEYLCDSFNFFESETPYSEESTGVHKFTLTKDNNTLEFTVTINKLNIIDQLHLDLYANGVLLQEPAVWNKSQTLTWNFSGASEEQIATIKNYCMFFKMTPEQYAAANLNPDNYAGTTFAWNNLQPGEYYIYAKFDNDLKNFSGGNTKAIHLQVVAQ